MRRGVAGLAALAVIAALPVVGDRVRARTARCATDGVAVDPLYRARIVAADGSERVFCGVRCAHTWLEQRRPAVSSITVTEAGGREIDARTAWFVRAIGTWEDGAPDFVRVFADRVEAERHVEAHGGEILAGDARPFGAAGARGTRELVHGR